jgi:hypothetical protein
MTFLALPPAYPRRVSEGQDQRRYSTAAQDALSLLLEVLKTQRAYMRVSPRADAHWNIQFETLMKNDLPSA